MPNNHFGSVEELCRDAYTSFGDTLDYIWKAPEFIELQEEIELEKLGGADEHIRAFRWSLESRKLYRVFPLLMANGNLFTSTSLFEIYLLQLAKLVEERTGTRLEEVRGQGIGRWLAYLRAAGIDTSSQALWPQVSASMKIRHCLMHTSGLLVDSRDRKICAASW